MFCSPRLHCYICLQILLPKISLWFWYRGVPRGWFLPLFFSDREFCQWRFPMAVGQVCPFGMSYFIQYITMCAYDYWVLLLVTWQSIITHPKNERSVLTSKLHQGSFITNHIIFEFRNNLHHTLSRLLLNISLDERVRCTVLNYMFFMFSLAFFFLIILWRR
jgi:hypothetical protein